MTTTHSRIPVIAAGLVAGFCIVLIHLWILMVHQHDEWALRSHENRWAFRSVPSQRGAIHDRHGRLLARDEPTMQLSIYYQRFRMRHPVGAAVHGATLFASLQPDGEGTRYGYLDGALGPNAAVEHLLSMPAEMLRRGRLPKTVAADLAFAATTVLSVCSGQSRKRVYGEMRRASDERGRVAIGDVLTVPRAALLAAFAANLASLHRFTAELRQARDDRNRATGALPDEEPTLLEVLDELRRASLEQRQVNGTGSLVETVRKVFDDHVPFDLAASLRIGAEQHPGLEITPSIARVPTVEPGTSLRALLGTVADLDRSQPDREWLDRHLEREMPDDWLDELVPAGVVPTDEERGLLQLEARARYERALLLEERRGTSGIEAGFNDALMGRLGLRLVERDSKRREQLLWSHLRVESGDDVVITIDADVQRVAEQAVATAQAKAVAQFADDTDRVKVEAALAVIDARSGDVLAYAGAPIRTTSPRDVPGVVWAGIGYLGSVVKPFVLLEQLQAAAAGRPHLPLDRLEACSGHWTYGKTLIKCGESHWDAGRDPVEALAKSCNLFFYQCAAGLGEDGLARAFRRVGLLEPSADGDPFAACWQPTVRGIPVARPRVDVPRKGHPGTLLPRRGIGYGVEASPLLVARAYAAIATGTLPTLGLLRGEARESIPLRDLDNELVIVREGMERCVEAGTARKLDGLQRLRARGKTGTAEVGPEEQNNAWFAGYLPFVGPDGVQLCFCAVVYWVPDKTHGGDAAGQIVVDFLRDLEADPTLRTRYFSPEGR